MAPRGWRRRVGFIRLRAMADIALVFVNTLLKPAAEQGPAVTVIAAAVFGVLALILSRRLLTHRAQGAGEQRGGTALGALLMLAVGAALEV